MSVIHRLAQSKWLKITVFGLFFGTVAFGLIGTLYVRLHYQAVIPRSPQPATGRIYPVGAQYSVVYVNRKEREFATLVEEDLFVLAFPSGFLYVFLGMRLGWFKKKPPWDLPDSSSAGDGA